MKPSGWGKENPDRGHHGNGHPQTPPKIKRRSSSRRNEAGGSTGDTELYVFAGMLAAVVISIRVLLFGGAGRAN